MTLEHINAILAFMQRVPLKGEEAPTFMECVKVLQAEAVGVQVEEEE